MARHQTYVERFPDNQTLVLHQEDEILQFTHWKKSETFEEFRESVSPVSLNGSPLSEAYIVLTNVSVYFNNSSPYSLFAWSCGHVTGANNESESEHKERETKSLYRGVKRRPLKSGVEIFDQIETLPNDFSIVLKRWHLVLWIYFLLVPSRPVPKIQRNKFYLFLQPLRSKENHTFVLGNQTAPCINLVNIGRKKGNICFAETE